MHWGCTVNASVVDNSELGSGKVAAMNRNIFCNVLYVVLLLQTKLYCGTLDTWPGGPQDGQAIVVDTPWTIDTTLGDYAQGAIAFKEGLHILDGGFATYLAVSLPLSKKWVFHGSAPTAYSLFLGADLHLSESTSIYGETYDNIQSSDLGSMRDFPYDESLYKTIYLDGDASIESGGFIFSGMIIDGQGHTLTLSPNCYVTFNSIIFRNITLSGLSGGNFDIMGRLRFQNVELRSLSGGQVDFNVATGGVFQSVFLRFGGTVRFTNFAAYRFLCMASTPDPAYFVIEENANVIIENSSLIRGRNGGWEPFVPLYFVFESPHSYLTLDNSTFGADDYWPWGNDSPIEQGLQLTTGTVVVKGKSALTASSNLASGRTVPIVLGDGLDAANDLKFKFDAGAILTMSATNTNCLITLSNVH